MIAARRRHLSQQPNGDALVLDETLAAGYPLVASPYLGNNVIPIQRGNEKMIANGAITPLARTDRGIAYDLSGGGSECDSFTYAGGGTTSPYWGGSLTELTIFAIIRSASGATTTNSFVVDGNFFYLTCGNYAGGVVAGMNIVSGSFIHSGTTTSIMGDGLWHVICGSYLGSTYLRYYLDGSLDAQNTSTAPASCNLSNALNINVGYRPADAAQFKGQIMLVVIVRKALEDSYIKRATANVEACWATLFRPRRVTAFLGGTGGGGGGGVGSSYRWFLSA